MTVPVSVSSPPAARWQRFYVRHHRRMKSVEEFIEAVNEQSRRLVSGTERAYDVGLEQWRLGMDGIPDEGLREMAWPLWLIWGDLTDRVDGPLGSEPGVEAEAASVMRRAAEEWLAISGDSESRRRYFDHWIYVECGYEPPRPDDAR